MSFRSLGFLICETGVGKDQWLNTRDVDVADLGSEPQYPNTASFSTCLRLCSLSRSIRQRRTSLSVIVRLK